MKNELLGGGSAINTGLHLQHLQASCGIFRKKTQNASHIDPLFI